MSGKNKFVFVAPMYNASATLPRLLHSLYGQSNDNWHLILIDDVSEKSELDNERRIFGTFAKLLEKPSYKYDPFSITEDTWTPIRLDQERSEKITFVTNSEKKWEVANVLRGISMCNDEDIICRIDADDWLTDLDALAMIDATYTQTGCEALWTMHRWGFSDKNISASMSTDADPYQHPWVSSHLKTFRKRLLNNVKDENFRGEDGNYIKRAGDQAIYLPVLNNTKKRLFIPRCLYHYTIKDVPETYQTDDAKFQRDEAIFLRQRGYVK